MQNSKDGFGEPPGVSGKAVEVLFRQKSFMAGVNEKLDREEFLIPGRGVNRNSAEIEEDACMDSAGMTQTKKGAHISFLQKLRKNHAVGAGDETAVWTIQFRVALVLVVTCVVLAVCGAIAFPALIKMWDAIKTSRETQAQIVDLIRDSWGNESLSLYLSLKSTQAVGNGKVSEKLLFDPPQISSTNIKQLMLFRRYIDPTFYGGLGLANLNVSHQVLQAAWNQSIGPGLVPSQLGFEGVLLHDLCASWAGPPGSSLLSHRVDESITFGICEGYLCDMYKSVDGEFPAVPDFASGFIGREMKPSNFVLETSQNVSGQLPPLTVYEGLWLSHAPQINSSFVQVGFFVPVPCATGITPVCQNTVIGSSLDFEALQDTLSSTASNMDTLMVEYTVYNGLSDNDAFAGYLITAAGPNAPPSEGFILANQSSNVFISASAIAVENYIGLWGVNTQMRAFGYPFTYSTALDVDSGESCDNLDDLKRTNCVLITANAINSGNMGENVVEIFSIAVHNTSFFVQKLQDTETLQRERTEMLREKENQQWRDLYRLLLIISFSLVFAVGFFAIWFSFRFGRSVLQLSDSMSKLQDLQFKKIEPRYFSHIAEINCMQKAYNDMSETIQVLEKFVPSAVVKDIVQNNSGKSRRLHVVRRNVTVMFTDIQGFTNIAESLDLKDLLYVITKYLSFMTEVIEAYGGVVGEVLGDGVLAFWNTPEPVAEHQAKACAAALAQLQAMDKLNEDFVPILEKFGMGKLNIRIGINTAKLLSGNIGSRRKMKFGCIGDGINLASRLEGVCKLYGTNIICSQSTQAALDRNKFVTRELDMIQVKGKSEPVKIFELVGLKDHLEDVKVEQQPEVEDLSKSQSSRISNKLRFAINSSYSTTFGRFSGSEKDDDSSVGDGSSQLYGPVEFFERYRLKEIEYYESALHDFQAGQFGRAKKTLANLKSKDTATQFLLERVNEAIEKYGDLAPPDIGWHGVLSLTSKSF